MKSSSLVRVGGFGALECFDKYGKLRWLDPPNHNLVVFEGIEHDLDGLFAGAAQIDPWLVGLTAATPVPADGDTMASHAGWTEFEDYSEAVRQIFVDVRSGQSVTNSASKAVFSIDAPGTVGGQFLVSNNTKGGSTGILLCVIPATEGNRPVFSGDTIRATYTYGSADDGA